MLVIYRDTELGREYFNGFSYIVGKIGAVKPKEVWSINQVTLFYEEDLEETLNDIHVECKVGRLEMVSK